MEKTKVRAWDLVDRVMDIHLSEHSAFIMDGIQAKAINGGFVRFYDFQVDAFEKREILYEGKPKKEYCLIGTDRYNKNLALPVDQIVSLKFKDTIEEAKLRRFNKALALLETWPNGKDNSTYSDIAQGKKDLLHEHPNLVEFKPFRQEEIRA